MFFPQGLICEATLGLLHGSTFVHGSCSFVAGSLLTFSTEHVFEFFSTSLTHALPRTLGALYISGSVPSDTRCGWLGGPCEGYARPESVRLCF